MGAENPALMTANGNNAIDCPKVSYDKEGDDEIPMLTFL